VTATGPCFLDLTVCTFKLAVGAQNKGMMNNKQLGDDDENDCKDTLADASEREGVHLDRECLTAGK
jgi:hypothetical protein